MGYPEIYLLKKKERDIYTRNPKAQYSVMTYMGKESKEWIYVYV